MSSGGTRPSKLAHDAFDTIESTLDTCIKHLFQSFELNGSPCASVEVSATFDLGGLMQELGEMEDTDDIF
jgi:hypothetical protein